MTNPGKYLLGAAPAIRESFLPSAPAQGSLIPALVGGAIGSLLWRAHPVLGFIGGASIAGNGLGLIRGGDRGGDLGRMATTGAGIGLALKWPAHPVLGFLGGSIATGTAVSYLAPSSGQAALVRQGR